MPSRTASESSGDSIHELLGPNLRQGEERFRKCAPSYGSTGPEQLSQHPATQASNLEASSRIITRSISHLGCDPGSQSLLTPPTVAKIKIRLDPVQIPGQGISSFWDALRLEYGALLVTPPSKSNTTEIARASDLAYVV